MQSDQSRPQPAVRPDPQRSEAGRSASTRKIDCAPRPGGAAPQGPGTGRGRGIPDPERWERDLRNLRS